MTNGIGEDLTRWTIRLALTAYFGALALRMRPNPINAPNTSPPANPGDADLLRGDLVQRGLWTLGCCLTWAHVACAFALYHHWSHDDAYLRTARETAAVVGIDWGGGLYFNYLFVLLWTCDVVWWLSFPAAHRNRSRSYALTLDAYLAFIAFNATVVFGQGTVRYCGVAATLGLVWLAWASRRREESDAGGNQGTVQDGRTDDWTER